MSFLASLFSLAGKTAIVTGATGGIGLDLATALAEAGCTTIVSIQLPDDPNTATLQTAIADISAAAAKNEGGAVQLRIYECDVSDSAALRAVFAKMWADGVVPDILLNCAGVNRRKPVIEVTDDDIDFVSTDLLFSSHIYLAVFPFPFCLECEGNVLDAEVARYITQE
jgi:2-deoxy-D-gluconate 3-dehydrogenase